MKKNYSKKIVTIIAGMKDEGSFRIISSWIAAIGGGLRSRGSAIRGF